MKVMIRKNSAGELSAYIAKKDLEEPIVDVEKPLMWGGLVTLANGWRLELPPMSPETTLPITVEARRLGAGRVDPAPDDGRLAAEPQTRPIDEVDPPAASE